MSARSTRRFQSVASAFACLIAAAGVVTGASAPATGAPAHQPRSRPGRVHAAAPGGSRASDAVRFHPGSAGLGDPYFPLLGNGGYGVRHYNLDLRYRPAQRHLAGVARLLAKAHANLSRFDLDLSGMHVHNVRVDGRRARFHRAGAHELVITPRRGLRRGTTFHVAINYGGSPSTIKGSPIVFGADYGWQYTKDGAFVGDEPNAAHTWFPCNDTPRDKASFTLRITVPRTRQVAANGTLAARRNHGHTTTFLWREHDPMATYLATVDIGRWRFIRGRTPGGIPETVAYDPSLRKAVHRRQVFRLTGRITDYWAHRFGPYPFASTGAIVDNVPNVGFSLETETRPLYGFAPDTGTMSHELSHQWFGDSVSVHSWRNIWLNEGFATFSAWLWREHTGGPSTLASARADFRYFGAHTKFWDQAIADPKRPTMFSQAVYERGGMTMAALRHRIGSHAFFRLLQRWTATHRYRTGTTAQFIALAERVSGKRLGRFFHIWLDVKRKPRSFFAP